MLRTIEQVKEVVGLVGSHFFEKATMRFFSSRVSSKVYPTLNGAYFVTSEQFKGSDGYTAPRTYTVRYATDQGELLDVEIDGKTFEHFTDSAQAHKQAKAMAFELSLRPLIGPTNDLKG